MTKPRGSGFVHDALFYADDDDLVRSASSFLRQGLDAGERVVVVCTDERSASLLRALDNDERVITLDQREVYRSGAAAISQYQGLTESEGIVGGPRVRLVGEIDFGDELDTWQEWEKYESVVNRYLAPYDIWAMCLCNTREFPDRCCKPGCSPTPTCRMPGVVGPTATTSHRIAS